MQTWGYSANEAIDPVAVDTSRECKLNVDVYNCGMLLLELISMRNPCGGKDEREVSVAHVRVMPS